MTAEEGIGEEGGVAAGEGAVVVVVGIVARISLRNSSISLHNSNNNILNNQHSNHSYLIQPIHQSRGQTTTDAAGMPLRKLPVDHIPHARKTKSYGYPGAQMLAGEEGSALLGAVAPETVDLFYSTTPAWWICPEFG